MLHPQTVVRRQAGAASPEAARALGPAAVPAPRPVPEERLPGSAGGFRSPNSVQGTAGWLSPKHLASHLFHFSSDFSLLEGWFWFFFFEGGEGTEVFPFLFCFKSSSSCSNWILLGGFQGNKRGIGRGKKVSAHPHGK